MYPKGSPKKLVTDRLWRKRNAASIKRSNRRYRVKNRIHRRKYHLKKYGLTIEAYTILLETQHGVCKICHEPPNDRHLAVDHDHKTGRVRGLLCSACNLAIGSLKDDPVRIQAALLYVQTA